MEKKRTYKSKSGAEYELVQTKPPTATKKKSKKAKGGKTYDQEIGGWVDPPSKNAAVRKLMSKRPKAKPSAQTKSSTKKLSQRARKSTSKRAAKKSTAKSQKPSQLKMF